MKKSRYLDCQNNSIVFSSASFASRLKFTLKPRPHDRNISTQHVATLLGATFCALTATRRMLLAHI